MTNASTSYGFGWIPELDGQHDLLCGGMNLDAGEHFGAPVGLPKTSLDMMNALPPVKDQGSTSTCVAHGIANGAETRLAIQGIKVPPSAVRQIYTLSNELLKRSIAEKLKDEGTYPRVAMKACADFGVGEEKDWPLYNAGGHVNDVTQEVPLDVLQRASSWKLKEQFTVYQTGRERLATVAACLSNHQPMPCAGLVDQVFMDYNGVGVLPASDPRRIAGGHMVCLIGYRTNAAGHYEFLIVNSWKGWGFADRSLAWVSEAWILGLQEIFRFTLTHGRVQ